MKIKLFGEVISDEWVWLYELFDVPHCNPKIVRDAIAELPEDEDLVVEVNSPGGDVWAGFEIYGLLRSLGARTEAHIVALAASAATTITSACTRVLASPVAQIMIHQPSVYVGGSMNNEETGRLQNFLDSVKASIINGYLLKCGGKTGRRKLENLVDHSTWMPAQEAIELGLVDGLLMVDDDEAELLDSSSGVIITNALGNINTNALLERYEAAVRAGLAEEVPGHPVKRKTPETAETGARPEAKAEAETGAEAGTEVVADAGTEAGAEAETDVKAEAESPETAENLRDDWRLAAAIELERARTV